MAMDALRRVGLPRRSSAPDGAGGASRRRVRLAPTRVVSATGSLVVHAILVAALAAIVWRTASTPTVGGREVTIAYDALAFSETPAPPAPAAAGGGVVEPPRPREVALRMEPEIREDVRDDGPEALPSLATMAAPEHETRATPGAVSERSGPEFSAGAAGGSASAAGAESAATEQGGVTFAGLGASNARSVVYVVDASGSMVTSLPLVMAEVERSVSRLSPTQKFGVVLFRLPPGGGAGAGVEVFAPMLVRATPSARERLHEWLAAAEPMGRSVPLAGLERGLAYKPDAVFLLSRAIERSGGNGWGAGGRGLAATLERIDQLNPEIGGRRAVVIQTIQFLDDDPTGTMQEIGRVHGARAGADGRVIAGYRVIGRGEDLGGGR